MADELEKEKYEEYLHSQNIEIIEKIELFKDKNLDTDQDGLKDFEEEYFDTDIQLADTDQDGYSDYEEVKNGYNPNGEGQLKKEKLSDIFFKVLNQ